MRRSITVAAHFAYGAACGRCSPRPIPGSASEAARLPAPRSGSAAIWAGSPRSGCSGRRREHPLRRNALMIGAHIAWGIGTAAALTSYRGAKRRSSPPVPTGTCPEIDLRLGRRRIAGREALVRRLVLAVPFLRADRASPRGRRSGPRRTCRPGRARSCRGWSPEPAARLLAVAPAPGEQSRADAGDGRAGGGEDRMGSGPFHQRGLARIVVSVGGGRLGPRTGLGRHGCSPRFWLRVWNNRSSGTGSRISAARMVDLNETETLSPVLPGPPRGGDAAAARQGLRARAGARGGGELHRRPARQPADRCRGRQPRLRPRLRHL